MDLCIKTEDGCGMKHFFLKLSNVKHKSLTKEETNETDETMLKLSNR